jgi:hypothetical protein
LSDVARDAIAAAAEHGEAPSDSTRLSEVIERPAGRVLTGFDAPWPTRPQTETQLSERTRLEEQLVASLMVHPEQSKSVLAVVPPEQIQDFRCCSAYEYLTGDTTRVDMTNELELMKEIQCRQEGYGPILTPEEMKRNEQDTAFVYRLAHTPVEATTGIEAAAALQTQPATSVVPGASAELGMELRSAPSLQSSPGLRP